MERIGALRPGSLPAVGEAIVVGMSRTQGCGLVTGHRSSNARARPDLRARSNLGAESHRDRVLMATASPGVTASTTPGTKQATDGTQALSLFSVAGMMRWGGWQRPSDSSDPGLLPFGTALCRQQFLQTGIDETEVFGGKRPNAGQEPCWHSHHRLVEVLSK